jgi:hypothetical protein
MGFRMVIGFDGHFDTTYDSTLQVTVTHIL